MYAVRYHWNDEACEFASAYILRDADKLDGLGEIGLERSRIYKGDNLAEFFMDIRLRYEWIYHIKTDTAKRLFAEHHLGEPFETERAKILNAAIEPVEL